MLALESKWGGIVTKNLLSNKRNELHLKNNDNCFVVFVLQIQAHGWSRYMDLSFFCHIIFTRKKEKICIVDETSLSIATKGWITSMVEGALCLYVALNAYRITIKIGNYFSLSLCEQRITTLGSLSIDIVVFVLFFRLQFIPFEFLHSKFIWKASFEWTRAQYHAMNLCICEGEKMECLE